MRWPSPLHRGIFYALLAELAVAMVVWLLITAISAAAPIARPDHDATPLTCDGHPAAFHVKRSLEVVDKAHDVERILDASPAKAREKAAWREHKLCLRDEGRRERIERRVDGAQERFAATFTAYINPPGMAYLDRLGACESDSLGGYNEPTTGTYGGRYQFDQQTWDSTAEAYEDLTGLAADPSRLAAPREQDIRASILYRARGTSPWPECG